MTIEKLQEHYKTEPFPPFILHLGNGRSIPVVHREFTAAPSGHTLAIYQPDDTFNLIDLLLVADIEVKPNGSGTRKRRKG